MFSALLGEAATSLPKNEDDTLAAPSPLDAMAPLALASSVFRFAN